MTDLAERLRAQAWRRSGAPKMDAGHTKMLEWEAADEIERLHALFDKWHTIAAEQKAEIERLKAKIGRMMDGDLVDGLEPLSSEELRALMSGKKP